MRVQRRSRVANSIGHKIKKNVRIGGTKATKTTISNRVKNLVNLVKSVPQQPSPAAPQKTANHDHAGKALSRSSIASELLLSGKSDSGKRRKKKSGINALEKAKRKLPFNATDIESNVLSVSNKKFNFSGNRQLFKSFPEPSPAKSVDQEETTGFSETPSIADSMEMYEKPMTPATMDTERKGSHTANNGCGGSNSEDAMELLHPQVPTVKISSLKKLRASLDSKDMGGAYYARRLFRALYTDEEIMSMTAAGQRSDKAVPMDVLTAVELEACRVFDFLLYFTDENKARKIQPNSKRKKRKEPSRKIYPPGTVPEGKIARECTIVEIFNDLKHNLIRSEKRRQSKRKNIIYNADDDAESVENLEVGYTTNKDIDAAELTTPNHRAAQESRSNAQESPLPNISPVLRSIGPWQMSNSSHQSTPKHLPLSSDQNLICGSSANLTPGYPNPPQQYVKPPSHATSHSAPSHSAPSHSASSYSAPLHSAPSHSAPSHSASSYSAPLHSAPSHSASSYSAPLHSAPSHSAPSHSASSYSAPLHSAPSHVPASHSASSYAPPSMQQYPRYDQVADQRFYYGMTQHYNQWGRYQQHSTFQPSSSIDTSYPAWQSHYHKHVNENPQPSGIVPEVAHFGQKTSDRNSTGNDLPTLTNSSEPHLDGSHSHYQNL